MKAAVVGAAVVYAVVVWRLVARGTRDRMPSPLDTHQPVQDPHRLLFPIEIEEES